MPNYPHNVNRTYVSPEGNLAASGDYYSHVTQELANMFPKWMHLRDNKNSVGQQFLSPAAVSLHTLEDKMNDLFKSKFISTAPVDEIDIIYRTKIPSNVNLTNASASGVRCITAPSGIHPSGVGNIWVEEVNTLEEFYYNVLPTRINVVASGSYVDSINEEEWHTKPSGVLDLFNKQVDVWKTKHDITWCYADGPKIEYQPISDAIINQESQKVSASSLVSEGQQITRDSSGNLHTIWFTDTGGIQNYKLLYAISVDNGQTWSDGEGGVAGSVYEVYQGSFGTEYPVIAIDSSNNICIVWQEYETLHIRKLYLRRKTNLGWQAVDTTSLFSLDHDIRDPRILIDSDDTFHIFARNDDDSDIYYAYSLDAGVTWAVAESFFSGTNYGQYIDFDIDLDNNIHIVYGSVSKLYYRKGTYISAGSYSWSSETEFTDGYIIGPIHILALDNGNIHIYWIRQITLDYVRQTIYSEGSWSIISSAYLLASYHFSRPQFGKDKNNVVHSFYSGFDSPTYKDVLYRKYENGIWSDESTIQITNEHPYVKCEKTIPLTNYLVYVFVNTPLGENKAINLNSVEVEEYEVGDFRKQDRETLEDYETYQLNSGYGTPLDMYYYKNILWWIGKDGSDYYFNLTNTKTKTPNEDELDLLASFDITDAFSIEPSGILIDEEGIINICDTQKTRVFTVKPVYDYFIMDKDSRYLYFREDYSDPGVFVSNN